MGETMRNSDRAWLALAGGVAAYDLIATDDGRLSDAARRYFNSQPVATASMILVTGLHLIGGRYPGEEERRAHHPASGEPSPCAT
jgi:hypothetical protein